MTNSRSYSFINRIRNPCSESETCKRWKVNMEKMMSKSDSELSWIIFCRSQCFLVVNKKLIRSNMKLLLHELTYTRRSFLVPLHTTNGYYCFNDRSVCSQFLQAEWCSEAENLCGSLCSSRATAEEASWSLDGLLLILEQCMTNVFELIRNLV